MKLGNRYHFFRFESVRAKMKNYIKYILIFLILTGISSCKSPSSQSKHTLRLSLSNEPPTLDPRKGGDVISSQVQFMLFEGLTRNSKSSSTELALAEKIDITDDQMTYTFHLRPAVWSSGNPVTAKDFEHAWKKMLLPNFPCPNANLLFPIKNAKEAKEGLVEINQVGVRALDDKTLEVKLEGPTPYFLQLTSFCVFFPVEHQVVEKHPHWAETLNPNFVGNGPFKLSCWKKNNKMVLVKNPSYWNSQEVFLDTIEISFIENAMSALQMYEKGDLDYIGAPLCSIPQESLLSLAKTDSLLSSPVGATTFCSFNVNTFPFHNKNIRKAFAYAIDRHAIVNYITQLDEQIAFDPVPALLKNNKVSGFFPTLNHKIKAKEYFEIGLKELNITARELNDLTFTYLICEKENLIAQFLQDNWSEVLGVKVTLQGYTQKVFLEKLGNRDYIFASHAWMVQYNDEMNILDRFKYEINPKNYAGWENAEYITLINHAMNLSNLQDRMLYLEQAEKILIEEMPIAPLYHWSSIYMKKPNVSGIHISPIGSIHLENTHLSKKVSISN